MKKCCPHARPRTLFNQDPETTLNNAGEAKTIRALQARGIASRKKLECDTNYFLLVCL